MLGNSKCTLKMANGKFAGFPQLCEFLLIQLTPFFSRQSSSLGPQIQYDVDALVTVVMSPSFHCIVFVQIAGTRTPMCVPHSPASWSSFQPSKRR